jgi:hypothetical protein
MMRFGSTRPGRSVGVLVKGAPLGDFAGTGSESMRGGGAGSVIGPNESREGAGAAYEAPEGDTTEAGLVEGRDGAANAGDAGTVANGPVAPSGPNGSPSTGAGAGNVAEPDGAGSVFVPLGKGDGDGGNGDGGTGDGGTGGIGVAGSSRCCVATR